MGSNKTMNANVARKTQPDRKPRSQQRSDMGAEIRELRKARKLTLQEMSKETDISLSYLSEIERGVTNPTVEAMEAIASALRVDFSWFFPSRQGKGPLERANVVRADNRRNLNLLYGRSADEIGYSDRLLSSSIGGGFYMGIARFEPGKSNNRPFVRYKKGTEHHGIVLEGELELTLENEVITLNAGDSYSYDFSIRHRVRNMSDKLAILVWGVSPVELDIVTNETE